MLNKRVEATARHRDGHRFPVELAISRFRHGDRWSFSAFVHDITERKRAEAEREAFIGELEAQHAELERYAYTVSHDLKNPVVTIKNFLGLLEQDTATGDTERMKHDLGRINTAADTMARLLGDLLELSRSGYLINPSDAVSLADLAHEAVALVAGPIAVRGIAVEIAADLPVVLGDRKRLMEVLQSLVDNAVKFIGDQPHPRIEMGAAEAGAEVVCFVRDNGVGIAPEYQETVFGLFNQLDPSVEGSGIGLAVAHRIVKAHGGRMWVESAGRGQGSTFFLALPREVPGAGSAGVSPASGGKAARIIQRA